MINPAIAAAVLAGAASRASLLDSVRRKPHATSTSPEIIGKLDKAYEEREQARLERDPQTVVLDGFEPQPNVPSTEKEQFLASIYPGERAYGSSGFNPETREAGIVYNPNADYTTFAHELGHIESQTTPMGRRLHSIARAVKQPATWAQAVLPAAISLASEGEDDVGLGAAAAVATAIPELLKEADAERHGLALMKHAGLRPDFGQRARMAGHLMSYLAMPLLVGGASSLSANSIERLMNGGETDQARLAES